VSDVDGIEAENATGHCVRGLQPHVVHAEGAQRSASHRLAVNVWGAVRGSLGNGARENLPVLGP
jgi:hypothetical protein